MLAGRGAVLWGLGGEEQWDLDYTVDLGRDTEVRTARRGVSGHLAAFLQCSVHVWWR